MALVERWFALFTARDLPGLIELLSEDTMATTADGEVFMGHAGFAQFFAERVLAYPDHKAQVASIEDLGDGFVLVKATIERQTVGGEIEALPGAWMVHVSAGKIASSSYYRSESAARKLFTVRG